MTSAWDRMQEALERDTDQFLLNIDEATDTGWDLDIEDRGSNDESDRYRDGLVQERIAAALAAIAFIMLRQDDGLYEAWKQFSAGMR